MATEQTQQFMRVKLSQAMGSAGLKDGVAPTPIPGYVAYQTGEARQIRLKICPVAQYWRRLEYSKLFEIGENGLGESELVLGYPTAIIQITGRNLRPIVDEIAEERCILIQAFDKRRWLPPADASAPYIANIYVRISSGDYSAAGAKAGQMGTPPLKPATN